MKYFRFKHPNRCLVSLSADQHQSLHELKEDIKTGVINFIPTFCLCESGDEVTISEVDLLGVYLRNVICRGCGIIRANPYMDSESLIIFYEKYYEVLYHGAQGLLSSGTSKSDLDEHSSITMDMMKKEFETSVKFAETYTVPFADVGGRGKNILMIGGRSGGRLYPFLENGNNCTVVDFELSSIKYARSRGLTAFSGDYKKIDFGVFYDWIICDNSLEHFLDIKTELAGLSKLLTSKGRLLLSIPAGSNLHSLYHFADSRMEFRLCHNYLFSKRSFVNLLNSFGFSLIKSDYLAHQMNLVTIFEKNEIDETTFNKGTLRDKGAYKEQIRTIVKAELLYGFYRLIRLRKLKEKLGPRLKNINIIYKLYKMLFFKGITTN